jgi:Fe-S oxidoreductase
MPQRSVFTSRAYKAGGSPSEIQFQTELNIARVTVATGNPWCHMQIGAGAQLAGMSLLICHPVELLDESYRQAGYYGKGS